AEQVVASRKKGGRKLAVDVLEQYMALFSALASTSRDDEAKFERYARLTVEVAAQLASYQTPKLKAVFIPDPGQQRSSEELISGEELTRQLEEHGLPLSVFGVDAPKIDLVPEPERADNGQSEPDTPSAYPRSR